MTVFIAMRTPRICGFDLGRRGAKDNATRLGSFSNALYSKKSDTRRDEPIDRPADVGRDWLFRQDFVVLQAAAWRAGS